MRYLLLFILFFLILRLVSHAYLNRPSVRGTRNTAEKHSPRGSAEGRSGPGRNARRRAFQEVEDADYEIIEEEQEKKQPNSEKR